MDDIYKGLSREEKIEMVYDLTLQNTNGRENAPEMYKLGIEACYEELCEANVDTSDNSLHKHIVRKRFSWSDFFIGVMAGIFAGVMIIAKLL